MREAFLGGTFDPIHIGHVWIAQLVCEGLKLDKVHIVPNYSKASSKWNKSVIASNEQRLHMCKLAIKGFKQIDVCSWEIDNKKLYTYQTVSHFFKEEKLKWIVGGDWLERLKTFKRYETLNEMCDFIVVDRPGELYQTRHPSVLYKPCVEFQLSSSYIRYRIKAGLVISGLINKDVEKFIKKEGLYVSC